MTQASWPSAQMLPDDELPIARTSKLAIASFISGMVCCIPLLGSAAVIMGAFAVARISQSRGRLDGRPLAIIGMVLGMLSLVLWVGLFIGMASAVGQVHRNVIVPTENAMLAIERQDWAAAKTFMKPSTVVTDEQWSKFRDAYHASLGDFIGLQNDLSIEQAFRAYSQRKTLTVATPGKNAFPLPVPYRFKNGDASVFLIIDESVSPWGPISHDLTLNGLVENLAIVKGDEPPILLIPAAPSAP
jgi:hypothetical protein